MRDLIHLLPCGDSFQHDQNLECPCGAELDEAEGRVRHRRIDESTEKSGWRMLIPTSRLRIVPRGKP